MGQHFVPICDDYYCCCIYMQIIIYNSGIKVCNKFVQRHKISLQQIRKTYQPAHQLFDLFILSAILQASKTEQYGTAKHLLLMGRSLLTGDVLVMVRFGDGPFWYRPNGSSSGSGISGKLHTGEESRAQLDTRR